MRDRRKIVVIRYILLNSNSTAVISLVVIFQDTFLIMVCYSTRGFPVYSHVRRKIEKCFLSSVCIDRFQQYGLVLYNEL